MILREYDPKRGVSVATLAYDYSSGWDVPEHAHGSDQLIYAVRGVMEVASEESTWLIPPQFALWIPARTLHRIHMPGAVSMRTLYFRTGLITRSPSGCAVLHVTPLLRELIVEVVRVGKLRIRNPVECALRDLTIHHVKKATPVPTRIALPRERCALHVAHVILKNPSVSTPLKRLCAEAGIGVRTLQRTFRKELGVDFASWRRQVRMIKAVQLLASGSAVKEAALTVGYRQPSAFVDIFRRTFGVTPKAWAVSLEQRDDTPATG